ncbi:Protein CBG08330 [Caenorhabditis briggsae]|uniref:Protein CBG08330 n=1 Tax=Caenorhabditis briggsae TaxID=6238 RepID=A8X6B5_CAEBR|nr:Protein CBG08330 [Caenorhabditis briggsae]CAP28176.2 Protein CBG08330 [Caenorhabditis briggsae]
MNRFLLLLFFLPGGIWCDHPLSSEEKQYWKANCGTKPYHPKSRSIAGGQPIDGNAAPWAVRVDSTGSCSGTIISSRHILTASHCFMEDASKLTPILQQANQTCSGLDWVLYPGSSWFSITDSYGRLLSNRVSRVIMMNYCFQPASFRNDDIMILELSENIQFDDYAYPACVSSWNWFNTDGQGTSRLRNGVFQITDYDNQGRFIGLNGQPWGVNTRPGDSGGSLIHYDNGRYYVIGVSSTGSYTGFRARASSVYAHFGQICSYTGVC